MMMKLGHRAEPKPMLLQESCHIPNWLDVEEAQKYLETRSHKPCNA
jgi:hypothetical protein